MATKTTTKARKPAYELTLDEPTNWEKYQHLYIRLLIPDAWNGREMKRVASLRWQSHQRSNVGEDRPSEWYGYNLEVNESDRFYEVEMGFNLLKKVAQQLEQKERTPANAVSALMELGWERMVYDARVSHHLPLSKVLPPDYSAYMFDYERVGEKHNPCGFVLARDVDEAKRLMAEELLKDVNWGAVERMKVCAKWVEADQPVQCLSRRWGNMYSAPVVLSTEEMLLSPKDRAAKVEAELAKVEAEAQEEVKI